MNRKQYSLVKIAAVVAATTGVMLGTADAAPPGAKPSGTDGGETTLLEIVGKVFAAAGGQGGVTVVREDGRGTFWRYFETWQTEVVRKEDGKLVRVDPLNPRPDAELEKHLKNKGGGSNAIEIAVQETGQIMGSAFPPPDWVNPDFDDSAWVRTATPIQMGYRSLALVCVRGKFAVSDPSRVADLNLGASIQGGAVVYLNGKEAGRFFLPQGKIANDTPAEDYPREAFFMSSGAPLNVSRPTFPGGGGATPPKEADTEALATARKDSELTDHYKQRFRHINLKIPANLLRKGGNVLAIEVHRAPALAAMFTTVRPKLMGYNLSQHYDWFWNRAGIDEVKLTAKAPAGSVTENVTRPAGVQLWNWPVAERVNLNIYGDPNESLSPIRLAGARNGAFAGQLVVSSPQPIKALKAETSDLKSADGQTIPKALVRVRYPRYYLKDTRMGFDPLEDFVPPVIPCLQLARDRTDKVGIQPVWVTVEVPKEAKGGDYAGTIRVSAEGLSPVTVPVQMHVSDWNIPDPKDFNAYMAVIQSPETLAIRYDVPMWSEQHWKLIDQSFQVIGLIGAKDVNITLVRETHFGNEHGMLWFVKKPDGSYEPYLDNVEKYIDIAVKRLGKIPTVSFYIIEQDDDRRPWITEYNPTTKELLGGRAPAWGTPQAIAFWKPAFDGFYKILAKYGMEKSLALATHAVKGAGPEPSQECVVDMQKVAPKAGWLKLAHNWGNHGPEKLESGPGGNPYHRVSLVSANYGMLWNPDTDKPFFGWRNPYPVLMYMRDVFVQGSALRMPRTSPEMVLFGGLRKETIGSFDPAGEFGRDTFLGIKGFGPLGADFWPVLGSNGKYSDIIARFDLRPKRGSRTYWYTVGLNTGQVAYFVGEGEKGPVSTVRVELMRESEQEAEAHIFCENALAEGKLGADLAKRCKEMCIRRLWALRYDSQFSLYGVGKTPIETHYVFDSANWQKLSQELYEMAAEVGKALGNK